MFFFISLTLFFSQLNSNVSKGKVFVSEKIKDSFPLSEKGRFLSQNK